ncbi:DUF6841 family protein [Aphanothece sacrum]|uniref:DUF6841 domain-containing protein n=1 Tax=Aphanothece sacrum FPU1 TaxID=1920663 RepID=A0A401IE12_APHSA|nr:hypothetical protein [Aphanothece sacrum]GBF79474.1 hypothetical protein AsFPU1_0870 [Aphanothece sacrum FPU1]GBF85822.1 hypothetical protein AsFPU3_2889 [Aphanothece sacrum FPU3]
MPDQVEQVRKTIEEYNEAFAKLKPSILFPFYHYPSILITQETAVSINNKLKLWIVFTKIVGDLKKQNYGKSQTSPLNIKLLSDNLAVVSAVATRYTKDNQLLTSFGFTYTMRKVEDRWKIIVGTIHDVDAVSS